MKGETRVLVTFPVVFPSAAYAIALSNEGTHNTDYASAYSSLTNTSVELADNSATVHYIVLGE